MTTARGSYHHGDLRRALLDAALVLTRDGGSRALALRDVTRQVGVSPNAAYRHFTDRDDLLRAVSWQVQEQMATRMREQPRPQDPADHRAWGRLRAVGLGYIGFALDEPGWFDVAFTSPGPTPTTGDATSAAVGDVAPPFALLVSALDELVEAGELTAAARPGAEWPCWSAVHGFCQLALHGPLRQLGPEQVWRAAERTVAAAVQGVVLTG